MTAPDQSKGANHGPSDQAQTQHRPAAPYRTRWETAPTAMAPTPAEEVTAPDRPAEHARNASEHANEHAANELLTAPKLAADDLRDRLRDTIHAATYACDEYHPAECLPCTTRARLLMTAVVRPVLDRQAAEITDLREQLRQARADLGRYDHYATQIGAKELDTE